MNEWLLPGLCILIGTYNLWAFLLMGIDKAKARKYARRIRERTLFLMAATLAGPGIWAGMYAFRHKTQHRSFLWWIPVITLLEYGLLLWLYMQNGGK